MAAAPRKHLVYNDIPAHTESAEAHQAALDIITALTEEFLLPVQYRDRFRADNRTGEQRLIVEVLASSVRDLLAGPGTKFGSPRWKNNESAEHYFRDTQSTDVFSLRTACELMNVDPGRVSRTVFELAIKGGAGRIRNRTPVVARTPRIEDVEGQRERYAASSRAYQRRMAAAKRAERKARVAATVEAEPV